MEQHLLTARLTRSVLLSEKTKHLEFEVEELPSFDFVAGQFISVREPRGDISSSPAPTPSLRGRAATIPSISASTASMKASCPTFSAASRLDETAHFHGPHGLFVLKPEVEDVIMVATGTGVAPFRSMARDLFGLDRAAAPAAAHNGRQIWLVYGTRYPEDIYYREEFEQLAAEEPNFHYICTLSRPPESWRGERGYVQEHVAKSWADARTCTSTFAGSTRWSPPCASCWWRNAAGTRSRVIYERYD